jgi:hypothetical protein
MGIPWKGKDSMRNRLDLLCVKLNSIMQPLSFGYIHRRKRVSIADRRRDTIFIGQTTCGKISYRRISHPLVPLSSVRKDGPVGRAQIIWNTGVIYILQVLPALTFWADMFDLLKNTHRAISDRCAIVFLISTRKLKLAPRKHRNPYAVTRKNRADMQCSTEGCNDLPIP